MDYTKYVMIPEWGHGPIFPPFEIPTEEWRDGLLIRTPNWLGDAVMAVPAVMQLKKILPKTCGLFILCPKGIAPLFESLPFVDRVIPLNDPHAFLTAEERLTVKRLQPGAGILFNNSFRDVLSLKLSHIPKLFGAKARFRSALLTRSYEFPKRVTAALNQPHQAAKYLSIAEALGAPAWNGNLPEFKLKSIPEEFSDEMKYLLQQNKILALAGGAAYGAAKRWPAESFREVARMWIEKEKGFVVVLGSKAELPIAKEIMQGLPERKCMNLAGKTSLDDLMLLLRNSSMCLANDSGVMHLAAVLGTPGVAPFGCTDPAATSPISKQWRIIFDKIECSPCFRRVCPKGTKECFTPITPELVWNVMSPILPLE